MRKSVTSGVFWSGLERFSVQGIQIAFSFIIARMLSPEDYGLVAMLFIFLAISQGFVDSGLSNALVQKKKRSEVDFSTVFYFNVVIALVAYLILCLSASSISQFYNQPLLEKIIYVSSLTVILQSFSSIQTTIITIELDYKRQAKISSTVAILTGLISLYMAYTGFGVWTLVFSSIISSSLTSLFLWYTSSWRPKLLFSWKSFKELFGFGYKLMIGGLIHHFYVNLYSLIIGKVYTKEALGYFNRANSMTQFPSTNIASILLRVFYPAECELQDDDEKLTQAYFRFIRHTMFLVCPLMFGLFAIAEPFIRLVLTEKWIGCVPYIQILCLAYLWEPVMMISWSVLNAKHRSDLSLKAEIIKKVTAFVILFISIPFGVKAMSVGLVFYSLADIFIISFFLKSILHGIDFISILRNLFPFIGISVMMTLVILCVNMLISSCILQIIVGVVAGSSVYLIISRLLKLEELKTVSSKIMSRL